MKFTSTLIALAVLTAQLVSGAPAPEDAYLPYSGASTFDVCKAAKRFTATLMNAYHWGTIKNGQERADRVFTQDAGEIQELLGRGYRRQAWLDLKVVTRPIADATVPLYRLYDEANTDHYYTTSDEERAGGIRQGHKDQGIAGHLLKDNVCNDAEPVHRLQKTRVDRKDKYITVLALDQYVSKLIRENHYKKQSILGFAWKA